MESQLEDPSFQKSSLHFQIAEAILTGVNFTSITNSKAYMGKVRVAMKKALLQNTGDWTFC
jgi:hypothetical protein